MTIPLLGVSNLTVVEGFEGLQLFLAQRDPFCNQFVRPVVDIDGEVGVIIERNVAGASSATSSLRESGGQ